ncbi:DUF3617 domain-containing protein [Sphingomonas sp. 28-63-12]|uniref:DUF3617 domain-containing protein n=1 Tax=Sphingomonas sp. 28-63-12 TaxID=1970434 RepID=UPI0035A865D7
MMRQAMVVIAGALALAGCGEQSTRESAAVTGTVSVKNASMAEVGAQVIAANQAGDMFQPGHWRGTVRIADIALNGAMPGIEKLPPAMRARMQARMAEGHGFDSCLTPEEAADARKALAKNQRSDCSYDHFDMTGGKIDAAMSCKVGAALQKMTMTGTYSRTEYRLISQASGGGGSPAGAMSMKMEITAHRIGDCAPGAK